MTRLISAKANQQQQHQAPAAKTTSVNKTIVGGSKATDLSKPSEQQEHEQSKKTKVSISLSLFRGPCHH